MLTILLALFAVRNAQGFWRAGKSDETGEHNDRQHVWDHLYELHWDVFAGRHFEYALHLDRERFGESKEKACDEYWHRAPLCEDQSSESDEPAAGSHVSRKE